MMGLLLPAILVLGTGFIIGPYFRQQCQQPAMPTEIGKLVCFPLTLLPNPNALYVAIIESVKQTVTSNQII